MSTEGQTSVNHMGEGRKRPFLTLVDGLSLMLDWSGRIIVVACLATMFVALFVNVVLRYAFGSGIPWAAEVHAILLPWLVAGGLVIASARSRHISITLLSDVLRGRPLLGLHLMIQSVILVIAICIIWTSQPILKASQFQTLSTLGIKQVWGYSSLVYAFAAIALISAANIIRTVCGEDIASHDPGQASLS